MENTTSNPAGRAIRIQVPNLVHERWIVEHLTTTEQVRKELLESCAMDEDDQFDGIAFTDLDTYLPEIMARIERYRKPFRGTVELSGRAATGQVFIFGQKLSLEKSLKYRDHSPSGFSWGYMGSGPSQLALAIAIELVGVDKALEVYQDLKEKLLAPLKAQEDFNIDVFVEIE